MKNSPLFTSNWRNESRTHNLPEENDSLSESLPRICGRDQLGALFNAMGLLGYGAEVGVQEGGFASVLREQWQGDVLYLVDRWRYEPGYQDTANVPQDDHDRLYQEVQAKFATHPGVRVMREESVAAAQEFRDGFLDWVYLDADHSLEAVAQDLAAWWPKIRRGGVFAGHDYCDGTYFGAEFGVKSAVDAFATQEGLTILTTGDANFPSWYCRKP